MVRCTGLGNPVAPPVANVARGGDPVPPDALCCRAPGRGTSLCCSPPPPHDVSPPPPLAHGCCTASNHSGLLQRMRCALHAWPADMQRCGKAIVRPPRCPVSLKISPQIKSNQIPPGPPRTLPPRSPSCSPLQGVRCEPPSPSPGPSEENASYTPHDLLERVQRNPRDVGRLRVFMTTCGGLRLDPTKVPRFITYRLCEASRRPLARGQPALCRSMARWLAVPRVRAAPLPGRGPCHPVARPPIGRLPSARACRGAQPHRVVGARPLGSARSRQLAYTAGPTVRRRAVVIDASAFLRTVGASGKVVAGNLDKSPGPRRGGWLPKAPAPRARWQGSGPRTSRATQQPS